MTKEWLSSLPANGSSKISQPEQSALMPTEPDQSLLYRLPLSATNPR